MQIGDFGYVPEIYSLEQNYPNPFNPITTIGFGLPEDSQVQILVYDISGRLVRTLVNDAMTAGYRRIVWDGRNDYKELVSAGVYIVLMKADGFLEHRKMVLLK